MRCGALNSEPRPAGGGPSAPPKPTGRIGRAPRLIAAWLAAVPLGSSCTLNPGDAQPVETEFLFGNLSQRWYAVVQIRESAGGATGLSLQSDGPYATSELIAPGAVFRRRFIELLPETGGCPARLDARFHLYRRVNENLPIGLDAGEEVDPAPVASGQILDLPACAAVVASTFTVILRDSEEGTGVAAFAQSTSAERVETFTGVNLPPLPEVPPLLDAGPMSGRVLMPGGDPVDGVGVLLRTRYRVTADDSALCPDEPVGTCFSDPIDFAVTDAEGRFSFMRPPGAYKVEAFADTLLFRPAALLVETPIDNLLFIAEPGP